MSAPSTLSAQKIRPAYTGERTPFPKRRWWRPP